MDILSEIIEILVGGITQFASGIGAGLSDLAKNIFLEVGEAGAVTGLSTFGILVVTFGAVSLTIGLSRWVLRFLTSWGN